MRKILPNNNMTKNRFLPRFEFQSTSNFDLHFSAKESKENCSKTVLPQCEGNCGLWVLKVHVF